MLALVIILSIAFGYCIGIIQKGVHIHINKNEFEEKEGYNPSMAQYLPNEVQQYYQKTNGFNEI